MVEELVAQFLSVEDLAKKAAASQGLENVRKITPTTYIANEVGPYRVGDENLLVGFHLRLDDRHGGIVISSHIKNRSNSTLFQEIAKLPNPHDFIKKIQLKGKLQGLAITYFVSWEEMGVPNIKSVMELFREFTKGNKYVYALASTIISPFNPQPTDIKLSQMFVPEEIQENLCGCWKATLDSYRYYALSVD